MARRLVEAMARPAAEDSITVECQASAGLSYTEGAERMRSLGRQADTALKVVRADMALCLTATADRA